MLGHLALVDHCADRERDFGGAAQRVALAGALGGEIGIATDDQALTGEVGCGDAGHVALVDSESWIAPLPSRSLIAGARIAVIQSRPAERTSSVMRASVIMPRSPTRTTWSSLKRCLSFSICVASVIGSPVLPSNTSIAMEQPSGAQSRP